ncbi:ParB-like nuclease domain protein [Caballeronia terrestris]|uniref:ParB-like nuclease domain protein n=1 Tax=Caballeronia terrestris TaxID=1226301 RepID=A0A158FWN0_9BURK|nr:ParB/RepB/Spo0J family partition protein [Caballeronia terrestris]SAL24254.1 ParB-like nuclease domain protein [Caballeronia terrestris]
MATTLKELETKWSKHDTEELPRRLPLDKLKLLPEVFQPRFEAHTDTPPSKRDRKDGIVHKHHVTELSVFLKRDLKNELDPITVLKVGRMYYLMDGHHRLAAYRLVGRQEIPVTWFPEGPALAVIEAGRINFKIVAQSDTATKTQRAWDMVIDDYGWSRSQIVTATTVVEKTVNTMRVAKRKLEELGEPLPKSWPAARMILRPERDSDTDEHSGLPKHVEKDVAEWTRRLKDQIPVLNNSGKADMLALALMRFSPKRCRDVALRLVWELDLYEHIEMEHKQLKEESKHAYEMDEDEAAQGDF